MIEGARRNLSVNAEKEALLATDMGIMCPEGEALPSPASLGAVICKNPMASITRSDSVSQTAKAAENGLELYNYHSGFLSSQQLVERLVTDWCTPGPSAGDASCGDDHREAAGIMWGKER